MKIIKLNATDSTNSFLKELALNSFLEDYTVVTTNNQTNGRGQMHTNWVSEPFKNLTFSVFTTLKNVQILHQPYLNFCVSLAVYYTLKEQNIRSLSIKWPNDIMAGDKKLCGILIETTLKKNTIKNTVIGIGLNVNQEHFSNHLKKVTSLKNITKKDFDIHILLKLIVSKIKEFIEMLENNKLESIYQNYLTVLYRKNIPTTFFNIKNQSYFMGVIKEVNKFGQIVIMLEDDSINEFGTKEVAIAKV